MPQQLTNLQVKEVSLVDAPANAETDPLTGKKTPRAIVALWKHDDEITKGVKYLVSGKDGDHLPYTGEDGKPNHRLMGAAWAALHEGYRGNRYEGSGKEQALARLRRVYESEGMEPPDSAKKGDRMTLEQIEKKVQEQDALLAKMASDDAITKAELAALKSENEVLKMSAKEKKAYAGFSAKQKEDYMAADSEKRKSMMDAACKAMSDDDEDDAKKRDSDAVLKGELATANAEIKKMQSQLTSATTELGEIRKQNRLNHFVNVAKSELKHTSGSPEQHGADLMMVADAVGGEETEAYKRYLGNLKSADQARAASFTEVGKYGGGGPAIPPLKELEGKAEEISKRDKCTIEKAMSKAMDEYPAIYAEYVKQKNAAARQVA